MKHFKFTYLCFALSALCLLLMSCKDDDDFVDKEVLVDTELVNYEVTLFRVLDDNQPDSLPENCILYFDNSDSDDDSRGVFFYEGNKYTIYCLPVTEMRSWTQNNLSVKVLLSGKFVDFTYVIPYINSRTNPDIVFYTNSITLK